MKMLFRAGVIALAAYAAPAAWADNYDCYGPEECTPQEERRLYTYGKKHRWGPPQYHALRDSALGIPGRNRVIENEPRGRRYYDDQYYRERR